MKAYFFICANSFNKLWGISETRVWENYCCLWLYQGNELLKQSWLLAPLVGCLNSVSCSWLSLFSRDHRYLQWNLVKELTYILLISSFAHQHLVGEKKLCIFSSCSELLSNSSPSTPTFNAQSDRQWGCIFPKSPNTLCSNMLSPLNLFID